MLNLNTICTIWKNIKEQVCAYTFFSVAVQIMFTWMLQLIKRCPHNKICKTTFYSKVDIEKKRMVTLNDAILNYVNLIISLIIYEF